MPESSRHASALSLAVLLAAAAPAHAQDSAWRTFVSVTPAYQGKADLDGGGDYSAWSATVRAGASRGYGDGHRAGVAFKYGYTDYSFSNPARFGGVAPWTVVQDYGVAIPLVFGAGDGWSLGFTPSVDWIRENGADASDALAWGAVLSATKRFADGNLIGFGFGVYDRIEKTAAYPLLLVDWRFGERWRLVNPVPAGPAGPAGLELDYRLDSAWSLGLGATWRTNRFRLSDSGPVANGVGEERGAPVFLRATHDFGGGTTLHLYAGVVMGGRLRVEDAGGNVVRSTDFDPAPLLGATFSARF